MTSTITEQAVLLTDDEIAVLNEARTILEKVDPPHTWQGGRIIEACTNAGDAVFGVLNVMNATGSRPMTDAQLFNRKPGE